MLPRKKRFSEIGVLIIARTAVSRKSAADAADKETRVVLALVLGQNHVGHELRDLLQVVDTLSRHRIGRNGLHRQGQFLEVFFTAACRDDDLLEHRRRRSRLPLSSHRSGNKCEDRERQGHTPNCVVLEFHDFPLDKSETNGPPGPQPVVNEQQMETPLEKTL